VPATILLDRDGSAVLRIIGDACRKEGSLFPPGLAPLRPLRQKTPGITEISV